MKMFRKSQYIKLGICRRPVTQTNKFVTTRQIASDCERLLRMTWWRQSRWQIIYNHFKREIQICITWQWERKRIYWKCLPIPTFWWAILNRNMAKSEWPSFGVKPEFISKSMCTQEYKARCATVTICATVVTIQKHARTHRPTEFWPVYMNSSAISVRYWCKLPEICSREMMWSIWYNSYVLFRKYSGSTGV